MSWRTRLLTIFTAVCLALFVVSTAAAAAPPNLGDDQNRAVAVNTEDGGSVFRLAFSVRWVSDGIVDQTNEAFALASCLDCQTVALAFQVVLVSGGASVVVPENRAVAYNEQCVACLTYASAFQLVLGVDGPSRLTGEGMSRLVRLWAHLRSLERRMDEMLPSELLNEVEAAKAELLAIFTQELVPLGPPEDRGNDDATGPVSTTTTLRVTTSTSSPTQPTAPPSTTTVTTVAPTPTTTTAPAP